MRPQEQHHHIHFFFLGLSSLKHWESNFEFYLLRFKNSYFRIAISVLSLFGTSPRMIMLGFMIPTMFLSMWISNTATSVLMIPILEVTLLLAITINILKGFLNCSGCAGWDRSECKCDEDDVPRNLLLGKCRRNWNSDRWQLIYNSMFSCNNKLKLASLFRHPTKPDHVRLSWRFPQPAGELALRVEYRFD